MLRQDADVRNGDTNAYIERYAPELTASRLAMVTEAQKEELKRRVIQQARARELKRGSTYHQFAQAELDLPRDRFAALNKTQVVGQKPDDPWPKLPDSSPWSGTPSDYVPYRDASQPPPLEQAMRGRFSVLGQPYVVGSEPAPRYPAAPGQADHSGTEPPLGYDNPALEDPTGASHSPPVATGDPASDAPRRDKTASAESATFDSAAGSPSVSEKGQDNR